MKNQKKLVSIVRSKRKQNLPQYIKRIKRTTYVDVVGSYGVLQLL